jgi:hypothetical protein
MSTNLVTRKIKSNRTLGSILSKLYYGDERDEEEALYEFFLSIDKAKQEMYDAQNYFDNVADPELIDHAIYKMEAAKSKYAYLIKQAKENGIKFNI